MTRKNNEEFIADLMRFSPYGALVQVFIMTAIERFAQAAVEKKIPDVGLISPEAWQGVARDILQKFEEHYFPRADNGPGQSRQEGG